MYDQRLKLQHLKMETIKGLIKYSLLNILFHSKRQRMGEMKIEKEQILNLHLLETGVSTVA